MFGVTAHARAATELQPVIHHYIFITHGCWTSNQFKIKGFLN